MTYATGDLNAIFKYTNNLIEISEKEFKKYEKEIKKELEIYRHIHFKERYNHK
jgi:hypothetical protein